MPSSIEESLSNFICSPTDANAKKVGDNDKPVTLVPTVFIITRMSGKVQGSLC